MDRLFHKRRNENVFKIKATTYEATLIINLMMEIVDNLRDMIVIASSKEKRRDYLSMRNTAMKLCKQFGIDLYDEEIHKMKPIEKELVELEEIYPIKKSSISEQFLKNKEETSIPDEVSKEEKIECL